MFTTVTKRKLMKIRYPYLILAILILLVELAIGLWVNDGFIRPYLGDLLVTILIYAFIMALGISNWKNSLWITMITCYVVETAQYFDLVNVLQLGQYKIARIIIGTHFSWIDMLCYTLAGIAIFIIETKRGSN